MFDAELRLPDIPDCSAKAKLKMEKDAAGVYMTGHPLDDYREKLKKLTGDIELAKTKAFDEYRAAAAALDAE